MLFDDRDLRVFDNEDSRKYFQEILQSYYSQNYRATVVLLYSFVIYDLFMKLQTMANEGDKKAVSRLNVINTMIADEEKYSKVENEVIQFFLDNCPLYFNRFKEDIEYLKNCRNKCAHLKVNDNSLYIPADYQVRMLICSMFDNVFSVKAPFIMDLFNIATADIERYSSFSLFLHKPGKIDDALIKEMDAKYFSRMTYDSLKKSYKTFIRLLFVTDDDEAKANNYGLYVFSFGLTDYIRRNGYTQIFLEESIVSVFRRIKVDVLKNDEMRRNELISLMIFFPQIMDVIRSDGGLFGYLSDRVVNRYNGLQYYKLFFPREKKTTYQHFVETDALHDPEHTRVLFDALNGQDDFEEQEFFKILVNSIPTFNGFCSADSFMSVFLEHMEDLSSDDIMAVMEAYKKNPQCTGRGRNATDMATLNKYVQNITSDSVK